MEMTTHTYITILEVLNGMGFQCINRLQYRPILLTQSISGVFRLHGFLPVIKRKNRRPCR